MLSLILTTLYNICMIACLGNVQSVSIHIYLPRNIRQYTILDDNIERDSQIPDLLTYFLLLAVRVRLYTGSTSRVKY